MIRMNYVLQSMNVFNSILMAAIAIIAYIIIIPAPDSNMSSALPSMKNAADEVSEKLAAPAKPPVIDYALISDQNIFHPDRKIPPEKKEEKTVPRPDVILYGTLITDQMSVAFIEDRKTPKTTPGRGKRQMTLHKGDQLSGYILRDIEANRIVLVKGEEMIVVHLEDGEKRKAAETSISPTTVGIMPGGPQPATLSSSLPLQSPAQKVGQTAPSPPQAVASPVPPGLDNSASKPSRRSKLEDVQKRKAERQMAAP